MILLVIVILYLVISTVFVELAYNYLCFNEHIDYTDIRTAEDYELTSSEHDLITSDNFKIHIYEVDIEQPKGIIIMLSGITGPSVTHFYGQAKLVSEIGFASILIDARGHGKSDGNKVTIGIEDVKDVQAVVNYINLQEKYQDLPIVIMGLSMGGATAINAASTIDDIDALISLSAFSSWTDVNVDLVEISGWPRFIGDFLRPGIILHGFLNYGLDYFNIVPEKTIQQIGNKPILFIHNQYDTQVPIANNYRMLEAYNGNNAQVWIRDSYEHFVVKDNDIDYPFEDIEYCNRILEFLEEVINSTSSFFYWESNMIVATSV